jgi:release factor glutamine methyltransferase
MLPTPSTSHIDVNCVYEPAEDSFLLLDTLSSRAEIAFLQQRFNQRSNLQYQTASPLVFEIGTGSGIVLAFITAHAQELFGRAHILTLGADVNTFACAATVETVRRACAEAVNGQITTASQAVFLSSVQADLGSAVRPHSVDVLVFNPPYVPSAEVPDLIRSETANRMSNLSSTNASKGRFEEDSHLLSLSYAGGKDGMEVTNRLLDQLPELLSLDRGTAYILLCKQNKPEQVMERVRLWGSSWAMNVVGRSGRTGGWEKLQVLRLWRVSHELAGC